MDARQPPTQPEYDMNIFKGLLFLEGYLTDTSLADDEFGPSYGNKTASQRAFRDAFSEPEFGRREAVSSEPCSAAGCG